jgi:hypothetical protein
MEKLTKDSYIAWKEVAVAELRLLKVLPVVEGTHRPPSPFDSQYDYWQEICAMLDVKFATCLPLEQWAAVKNLPSLSRK